MTPHVPRASDIAARLDRLPAGRELWRLIVLISLGACFEIYDLLGPRTGGLALEKISE